jgi:predicted TIM-barrel fold metal-dependent hydrolase
MKVVAFEEHYKTHAIAEANKANPIEQVYEMWQKLGRFPGDPSRGVPPGIYDLDDKRIAAMDEAGIDVQILSHTAPGPEELEPRLAVDLARQANDAAHATVTRYPDRFRAFATLPMRDPSAAVKELERTVRQLGFVGALINGHVNGHFLDDKVFWPVFECAAGLNVPIYLHPNRPPQPVVSAYYEGFNPIVSGFLALAGVGWHVDTGLHALRLILGGVFDAFPRLQIIVGHNFEILSWTSWRATYAFPPKDTGLKGYIIDYLRQNFYGGILAGEFSDQVPGAIDKSWNSAYQAYLAMVNTIGVDRTLFTTDTPYGSMKAARQCFDRMPIDENDKRKIAYLNAERLLGLSFGTEKITARRA